MSSRRGKTRVLRKSNEGQRREERNCCQIMKTWQRKASILYYWYIGRVREHSFTTAIIHRRSYNRKEFIKNKDYLVTDIQSEAVFLASEGNPLNESIIEIKQNIHLGSPKLDWYATGNSFETAQTFKGPTKKMQKEMWNGNVPKIFQEVFI